MKFLKFIAKAFSYLIKVYNLFRMGIYKMRMFIRGINYKIKMHFQKQADKKAKSALSNDYVYFVLKLAQVYSRNKEATSVNKIYSMKEFCNEFHQDYKVIEVPHKVQVCCPQYYGVMEEKIENFETKEIYISTLHNAVVSGASSVIACEGQYIYDPLAFDSDKRLDIKFASFIASINGEYFFEKTEPEKSVEKAIFLMGFASYNYYHLTIEIFSRLQYIDERKEYDGIPILVDEVVSRIPQYRELLCKINTNNREIIFVEQSESVSVGELIYPAYNTWMPINVKNRDQIRMSDFVMSESGLQNLRNAVQLKNSVCDRKIFVSREKVASSRLENEKQIRDLFASNGFEIVHTENMTFDEQVECFNSAKCVVAASGAALTNLVYCQPGTIVCCIIPEEYKFYAYSTIAYMLKLQPVFLDAEVTERTPYPAMDLFHADIDMCEKFIKNIINE